MAFGIVVSVMFLGEQFALPNWLGVGLIAAGAVLVAYRGWSSGHGSPVSRWCEIPKQGCHQQEGRHVSGEMAYLVSVIEGLRRHDSGIRDARPDGERDQAPVRRRIASDHDQEGAQHGVNPPDHLQIILPMTVMPAKAGTPLRSSRMGKLGPSVC